MRDFCLFKNVSDGMEAETFVEGDGVELGVETQDRVIFEAPSVWGFPV